ncbi:MAG: hypothetical protein H0V73_08430 [Chloroflexi bacterium]|nr:hypothetical protein [Chloroflexota bacterium]
MTIRLARPEHITVRRLSPPPTSTDPLPTPTLAFLVGAMIRGLLVGAAIGILVVSGHTGAVSVTTIGIIAIGVALLSWEP